MSDYMEFFLMAAVIIAVIFLSANMYVKYQCIEYEKLTGRKTQHVAFDTCYIDANGTWYRYEEYTKFIVAKDGLISQ